MRRRIAAAVCVAAALLLVPVAVAATPGTYDGWLYKADGERWRASFSELRVRETPRGQQFRLSVYNMRLGCPYPDRNGRPVRALFRFVHRGPVEGARIDDTRRFPKSDPTHLVRLRGTFVGRRFSGRITVRSAPGVTGACTGSARVRVAR